MTYLITQILFSLLATFLLGFLLGWLFARYSRNQVQGQPHLINPSHMTKTYAPPPPVKTAHAAPAPVAFSAIATPQSRPPMQVAYPANTPQHSNTPTNAASPSPAKPPVSPIHRGESSLDSSLINLAGEGYEIETLEGVGPKTGRALRDIGIETVADFLRYAHNPVQRETIAERIAVRAKMVNSWASMSDLLRIEGVDHQSAELMSASGIRSVSDLAEANVVEIIERMHEVNTSGKRSIAPQVPTGEQMIEWIGQANRMKPVVKF